MPAANKMFALWPGEVLVTCVIFVQRLVSGTARGFGSRPHRKHKRCRPGAKKSRGQCSPRRQLLVYAGNLDDIDLTTF